MQQQQSTPREKKPYVTPRLSTHGDVAKLTQQLRPPGPPGSGIEIVFLNG
jgi:hypothetical protein